VEATERLADDHVATAEVERDREVALPVGKHVDAPIASDVPPNSHNSLRLLRSVSLSLIIFVNVGHVNY
jgi:hypothetical protein